VSFWARGSTLIRFMARRQPSTVHPMRQSTAASIARPLSSSARRQASRSETVPNRDRVPHCRPFGVSEESKAEFRLGSGPWHPRSISRQRKNDQSRLLP
jgi:hypothetical protein